MKYIRRICCAVFIFLAANIPLLYHYVTIPKIGGIFLMLLFLTGLIVINIIPAASHRRLPGKRLKICADGCELLIYFLLSVTISIIGLIITIPALFPENKMVWFGNLICVIIVEALVFWCGMIRVYLTSSQI